MNILEQIYDNNFHKINFLERKISIDTKNTILKGPPKSGKTYLIYDYLSQFEIDDYLYIDCDDYKNNSNNIENYLDDFIIENKIEVLVLENFKFNFNLPKVTSTIITTSQNKTIENFETIYLTPLDFEEFILFDTKHQNIANSFNSFLKFGNFPEIIEFSEQKKAKRNYEICQLYCEDKVELEILFLLIKSTSEKKSIFQLFNTLKKTTKISKDRFYKTCEKYEQNHIIYFCTKYEQPNAVKKIYIFNHSLLDIVSYNKNFNNLFQNMVYLEIYKKHKEIFYLDNIDFYIPEDNLIILTIPFFNHFEVIKISMKLSPYIKKLNIKKIFIVTVSNEKNINIGDIDAKVIKFYDWVLGG
ncbi:MAG: ATP-binding protein [Campylobacterota bacterium]|nr:ATP-binding protein [Campylobacterota bacterium]